MLFERDAVLNQIYRAILTSPTPLPDTVFTFSITDTPRENGWSFARSNDPNANRKDWVMPHFAFFSWPKPFIGTVDEALAKINRIEENTSWEQKIPKAVWRGTGWFNSVGNTQLRPNLLKATKGKDWADVEVLKWETNGEKASNSIGIEDFCKYKYILYTEVSLASRVANNELKILGNYLFRATPLPHSMQFHHHHPATHIYDAYDTSDEAPLLLLTPILTLSKLQNRRASQSPLAKILLSRSSQYRFRGPRMERARRDNQMAGEKR